MISAEKASQRDSLLGRSWIFVFAEREKVVSEIVSRLYGLTAKVWAVDELLYLWWARLHYQQSLVSSPAPFVYRR